MPSLILLQIGTIPSTSTEKAKQTGIPLPIVHQNITEKRLDNISAPHLSDIQSVVTLDKGTSITIACSDAKGVVSVSVMEKSTLVPKLSYSFSKTKTASVGEMGWTGIALHPTDPSQVAVANFCDRSISVWDGEKVTRELGAAQWPTQIGYIPGTELLAVTEYNQLAIYDLKSKVPCIKRVKTGSGALYAMSAIESGVICGGADRAVHVYDTKKWAARGHWSNALKYEISAVYFTAKDEKLCFVGGVDSELLCGNWSGKGPTVNHYDGFRGDSRWIGLAKYTEGVVDTLAGVSERGTLNIFRNGVELYPHLHPEDAAKKRSSAASDGGGEEEGHTGGKRPKFYPAQQDD